MVLPVTLEESETRKLLEDRVNFDPILHEYLFPTDGAIELDDAYRRDAIEYMIPVVNAFHRLSTLAKTNGVSFFEKNLEEVIGAMTAAAHVHYHDKRKDEETPYIEHPLDATRRSLMSVFEWYVNPPDWRESDTILAYQNAAFRKQILQYGLFKAKELPNHDAAEHRKKYSAKILGQAISTREAVSQAMTAYSAYVPNDRAARVIAQGLAYLTPNEGETYFESVSPIFEIPNLSTRIRIADDKNWDRQTNTEISDMFSERDEINNAFKNFIVLNQGKRYIIIPDQEEPQRMVPGLLPYFHSFSQLAARTISDLERVRDNIRDSVRMLPRWRGEDDDIIDRDLEPLYALFPPDMRDEIRMKAMSRGSYHNFYDDIFGKSGTANSSYARRGHANSMTQGIADNEFEQYLADLIMQNVPAYSERWDNLSHGTIGRLMANKDRFNPKNGNGHVPRPTNIFTRIRDYFDAYHLQQRVEQTSDISSGYFIDIQRPAVI